MSRGKRLAGFVLPLAALVALPLAAEGQVDPTAPSVAAPVIAEEAEAQPAPPPPQAEEPAEPRAPIPDSISPFPGGFSGLLGAPVGHLFPRIDYRAEWFPDEPVQGQDTDLGYVEQDFSASVPVWQDPRNDLALTTNLRAELFHTGAVLPDTHQPFPDDLWNVRFGSTYRHLFENDWVAGGSLSVGTATDKPFTGVDAVIVGLNTFLRIPEGEHNAWLFSLSYSTNSELPIPIPMVAFIWQPSDCFRANIGLPFQVTYRPLEDLTLDFSYMLIRTVHARATYRLEPHLRVYGAFDWSNESWFLADRPTENDRFFYYDKRLSTGLQWTLAPHASLDLSGGYVFDRFYFEGDNYSDRNFNRLDVGDGPFVALRFDLRF